MRLTDQEIEGLTDEILGRIRDIARNIEQPGIFMNHLCQALVREIIEHDPGFDIFDFVEAAREPVSCP